MMSVKEMIDWIISTALLHFKCVSVLLRLLSQSTETLQIDYLAENRECFALLFPQCNRKKIFL